MRLVIKRDLKVTMVTGIYPKDSRYRILYHISPLNLNPRKKECKVENINFNHAFMRIEINALYQTHMQLIFIISSQLYVRKIYWMTKCQGVFLVFKL